MFISTLIILLTTLAFTSALPPSTPIATPHPQPHAKRLTSINKFGFCPDQKAPTEASFVAGYTDFCSRYIGTNPTFNVSVTTPLMATYTLDNADGSKSQWVYQIRVQSTSASSAIKIQYYFTSQDTCVKFFRKFLDTNEAGGLSKSYCVVEGTGGEASSGQGTVCVLGGKVENKEDRHQREGDGTGQGFAWLGYESFRKTGTKAT